MTFTASLADIVERNENGLLSAHPYWCRVSLDQVAAILNGFPFRSAQFTNAAGTPLLRIRDILSSETETYFDGEYDPSFLIRPGDLVVGMDGDFNSTIWRGRQSLLNQRVCKLSPNEKFYRKKLLAYVLPGYLRAINAETSSVTVKHLSSNTIAEIPLPLPPLPEQDRILGEIEKQFTRLDAAVAALKRVQANLKRYRAAVLKAACEGRLVPTEAELARREGRPYEPASVLLERIPAERQGFTPIQTQELTRIPEGWVWVPLGPFLHSIKSGKSFKCEERPPEPGEVGVVKVSAVTWGEFDERESKTCLELARINEDYLIHEGDFLFSRANTIELVGACVIVKKIDSQLMLSDKILRFQLNLLPKEWVLYCLRSQFGRIEIERLSTGNQESMRNIGQERIRSIRIPLPPLAEIQQIISELERRLSIINEVEIEVENDLKRSERLRQSILKRAFEGKLAPQDPNDEPASALLERIRGTATFGCTPGKQT